MKAVEEIVLVIVEFQPVIQVNDVLANALLLIVVTLLAIDTLTSPVDAKALSPIDVIFECITIDFNA